MNLKAHYYALVTAQMAVTEEDEKGEDGLVGESGAPNNRKFSKQISVMSSGSHVSGMEEEDYVPDSVSIE